MQNETERAEPEAEAEAAAPAQQSGAETSDADEKSAGTAEAPPDDGSAEEPAEAAEAYENEEDGGDEALKDQLLRALADAENARRRARKDVEDARAPRSRTSPRICWAWATIWAGRSTAFPPSGARATTR